MTANGPMSAFLDSVYDEALDLMSDIRDSLAEARESDMNMAVQLACATSDVSEIFAWILVHKAVQSGELSAQEAFEHPAHELPNFREPEGETAEAEGLPDHARNLAARTRTLRMRAGQLNAKLLTV